MSVVSDTTDRDSIDKLLYGEEDKWDALAEQFIPSDLQGRYEPLLGGLSGKQKIQLLSKLQQVNWEYSVCVATYILLKKPPAKYQDGLIDILHSYASNLEYTKAVDLFLQFNDELLLETLSVIGKAEIVRITAHVTKYLNEKQLNVFINLANTLTMSMVIQMLDECNEPFAKQCRLCRSKRLYSLHERLVHNQIPEGMAEVVGNMALLNKHDIWSADNEKGYRFDVEKKRVFWNREVVDLVNICDGCLSELNRAASCCTRYDDTDETASTSVYVFFHCLSLRCINFMLLFCLFCFLIPPFCLFQPTVITVNLCTNNSVTLL